MPEPRAREIGSSSQPLLSLAIGEGNPDLKRTRLALRSSSLLHESGVCWNREELGEEKREEECWILREIHVSNRKTERRKGKAWGFFRKFLRCENDKANERERLRPWDWLWNGLSKLWGLVEDENEMEFLLGFAIVVFSDNVSHTNHCPSARSEILSPRIPSATMISCLIGKINLYFKFDQWCLVQGVMYNWNITITGWWIELTTFGMEHMLILQAKFT